MEIQDPEMEILHSDACSTASLRKKCRKCLNEYYAAYKKKKRMEKKPNPLQQEV